MRVYECRKCRRKVALDALIEHRAACAPDAELLIPGSLGGRVGRLLRAAFLTLLAAALAGGGWLAGQAGFDSIARMRSVERIPPTEIFAVVPGPVNLAGRAEPLEDSRVLASPRTGTRCLHYRYTVEREERDSDGDTHWSTIEDVSRTVDFRLVDATGAMPVRTATAPAIHLPESFQETVGDLRYTEWRIDVGDEVFLLGCAVPTRAGLTVDFPEERGYEPILSKYGEYRERRGMATASVLWTWTGLVCVAFAVGLLMPAFGLHRILVFFSLLTLAVTVYLVTLGLDMMRRDLADGAARLQQHAQSAQEAVRVELGPRATWDGDWEALDAPTLAQRARKPDTAVRRIERIRQDLAVAVERYRAQRYAFPERHLAPGWGFAEVAPLPVPPDEAAVIRERAATFRKARFESLWGWIALAVCGLVAWLSFHLGFQSVRHKRMIENIPTAPTAGVAFGLSEVKGIVDLPERTPPLTSPLTQTPTVCFTYKIEELRGSGKRRSWVTIHNEDRRSPFVCRDAQGALPVRPDGAEVMTQHTSNRSEGKRRYTETRLELHDPLYAFGRCELDPDTGDSLRMQKPAEDAPFVLSNRPEDEVMRTLAARGVRWLNVAFAAVLLLALTLFGLRGAFAATDYLASALVAPLFMIFVAIVLHYNDLHFLRERAERNAANIDVSLKKRHDLLPALEAVVKAYAAHERGLQENLAAMRTAFDGDLRLPAKQDAAVAAEHQLTAGLIGALERYPDLKAGETHAALMRTLVSLENEVAFMRKAYNDAVEIYNARIETFPDLLLARPARFRPLPFYQGETTRLAMPPRLQEVPPPATPPLVAEA